MPERHRLPHLHRVVRVPRPRRQRGGRSPTPGPRRDESPCYGAASVCQIPNRQDPECSPQRARQVAPGSSRQQLGTGEGVARRIRHQTLPPGSSAGSLTPSLRSGAARSTAGALCLPRARWDHRWRCRSGPMHVQAQVGKQGELGTELCCRKAPILIASARSRVVRLPPTTAQVGARSARLGCGTRIDAWRE